MLRVLMVLEDYGELMFLQTVLKKLGFDVDATQNPRSLTDGILRMNPDILVMTAYGKRVKGYELNRGLRKVRGLPHTILLRQDGQPQERDMAIDGWMESPVAALDLVYMIADLAKLDRSLLADKFSKLHLPEIEHEKARILHVQAAGESLERSAEGGSNFGILQSSTMPEEERKERYKKFLNEAMPVEHRFAVREVHDQVKLLRERESTSELEELERQRKAFVEHLFKKKP